MFIDLNISQNQASNSTTHNEVVLLSYANSDKNQLVISFEGRDFGILPGQGTGSSGTNLKAIAPIAITGKTISHDIVTPNNKFGKSGTADKHGHSLVDPHPYGGALDVDHVAKKSTSDKLTVFGKATVQDIDGRNVKFKKIVFQDELLSSDYMPSSTAGDGLPGESGAGAGLTQDEKGKWRLEVDYLLSRLAITTPELIKNRVTVTNNQTWFSDNGIVESVEEAEADNERIVTIAKERGGGSTFQADDLLLGIILNEENGGFTYQKVQLLVREVLEPYRLRVSLELPTAPIADLILVRTGNRTDIERQNSIFIDASLPAMFYYVGVDSFNITTKNVAQATGNLRGLNFGKLTQDKPIQERFSNVIRGNNYQSGKFFGISGDGVEYPMIVERGTWVEWETYYHYDRVSYNGSLWDCAVESTRKEPNNNSYDWSKSVSKGEPGTAGAKTATVMLYLRSEGVPSRPPDWVTYFFDTQSVGGYRGEWKDKIPDGDLPLYVIGAIAYSETDNDIIYPNEWSEPVVLAQNGSGINTAAVRLYARGAVPPSMPDGGLFYTFATASLNYLPFGWWPTEPATNGEPLWMIAAMAVSPSDSDTIEASEWSTPVKILQDGAPAPLLKSQFSVDGISGWHDEPQPGDAYRRDSNDNGLTWSKPYRIRGEDGVLGINLLRSLPWALRNSTTAVYVIEKSRYPELFGVAVTFKLHQFIYDFSRMWIEEYDSLGNQTRSPSQWDQSQHLTLSTSIHSSSMCIVVQTNYMDVPKLIKAKLEQGSVATPWSVSEEDRKQIELEIRAVTDNFTAQDGGMLMTSLIKLLNSGREMAGFSGLGTGADPALWIGGTYADALANNTSVVMRAHGGSKIGTFSIDDKGLGAFTNQSDKRWMMLYDDLVPEMEYFLWQPYNDTYQHDASQIFVPQFNIESQYLTTIYLGWSKLSAVELKTSITLYAYEPNPTVHGGTVTASVYLTATSGNILIGTYSHSVGTYAKPGDQAQDYRTFPIVYSSNALPKRGRIIVKYSMTASHYPTGGYYDDFRGSVQLMNATAMTSWNLKSFVGKGLAMFVDNNNYIHFGYNTETGSVAEPRRLAFRMKSYEDPDMPGVLASCRIEENGKINRNLSYGSKISLLNDGIRDSNGKYTVYHSIGHTQYQVYVTLCGSLFGFARVVTRSKDRVTIEIVDHKNSAFTDSAFNILLVGNNQIKN